MKPDYKSAYIVTCPKCGTHTVSYWIGCSGMGSVNITDCHCCGYTYSPEDESSHIVAITDKVVENLRDKEREL